MELALSLPIPLRLYTLPYWSNPLFKIFYIRALWTERQSARMSKIKNSELDQYGAEPFEQQQFGTAGIEGVKAIKVTFVTVLSLSFSISILHSSSLSNYPGMFLRGHHLL